MTSDDQTSDAPIWQRIVWKLTPSTTVGRALVSATERLRDTGNASAYLDAQVILAHVLQTDRSWLFAHYDYTLSDGEADAFTELIARRAASEPVAYLVGRREFYGLDLAVDRRVLIPRPETEMLVDEVLRYISLQEEGRPVPVADVGTGSGAIALSVAVNAPQARLFATDISLDALDVARHNAERFDALGQVSLLHGDLLAPLESRQVEVVAANLPYVNSQEYALLDADVRDYEPKLALEAGPEGLDAIRRLLGHLPRVLRPGGMAVLEIGYDQGPAVWHLAAEMLPDASHVEVRRDYNGLDRMLMIVL